VALSDALQEKLNLGKQCGDSSRCVAPNTPLIYVDIADYLHDLPVPRLPYLIPPLLSGNGAHLLDYCGYSKAYCDYRLPNSNGIVKESRTRILAPIMDESLAHFILKIAMINPISSSNLVLEGIFALSSVLLLDLSKSLYHKSRLISMLQRNITRTDRESVIRNLVATMLLFQCEVFNISSRGALFSHAK
jgi:hypothetical protein